MDETIYADSITQSDCIFKKIMQALVLWWAFFYIVHYKVN